MKPFGCSPVMFFTKRWKAGMRVAPPTSSTWEMDARRFGLMSTAWLPSFLPLRFPLDCDAACSSMTVPRSTPACTCTSLDCCETMQQTTGKGECTQEAVQVLCQGKDDRKFSALPPSSEARLQQCFFMSSSFTACNLPAKGGAKHRHKLSLAIKAQTWPCVRKIAKVVSMPAYLGAI